MKIKIGVREYDIRYQDEIIEVGGELYGRIDHKGLNIIVASKFPAIEQDDTFLHEILHGICNMQNLRDIDNNEHWINLLAAGLHMVIVDNPSVFSMNRPKEGLAE